MAAASSATKISVLPNDVIQHIMNFSGPRELAKFAACSKGIQNLVNDFVNRLLPKLFTRALTLTGSIWMDTFRWD
jgi:hypothetical protein